MRQRFLFLAPLLLAGATVLACGEATRRSAFQAETKPTEPVVGFDNEFETVDAGDSDGSCSSSQTTITRTPVVIEFVVDQSTSMDSTPLSKWVAARDALLAAFEDMNSVADPATFVGLMRYSGSVGAKVAPGLMGDSSHYDDIVDVIDTPKAAGPGGTETLGALNSAYAVVEKFKPPASSGLALDDLKRIVVLVSDGVPTAGTQDDIEALAKEKFEMSAPKGPIPTFSIGIGPWPTASGYDPKFMGRIAVNGGTAPPNCDVESADVALACHFQVTPGNDATAAKQAFLDALNTIRALTASCEFGFTATKETDLKKIEVIVTNKDGSTQPIPQDADHGWTFDDPADPKKVVLHGDACAATNGTVSGRVDVVLGCAGAR
jgi:uncharacterized protein YegL